MSVSPCIEGVREYLVERGRSAYMTKREEVEAVQPGLMGEAERFFVLSQTDNLWKAGPRRHCPPRR
jgi:preprotein translocase subunit SecA